MTAAGWCMLVVSWSAIGLLTGYTVWRTLRTKTDELSAPLDLEAEIQEEKARREER